MTDEPVRVEIEPDERLLAARAAKVLIEAAKHDEDIREMIAQVCARFGVNTIVDLTELDPAGVIAIAEAVGMLDEQTYRP